MANNIVNISDSPLARAKELIGKINFDDDTPSELMTLSYNRETIEEMAKDGSAITLPGVTSVDWIDGAQLTGSDALKLFDGTVVNLKDSDADIRSTPTNRKLTPKEQMNLKAAEAIFLESVAILIAFGDAEVIPPGDLVK